MQVLLLHTQHTEHTQQSKKSGRLACVLGCLQRSEELWMGGIHGMQRQPRTAVVAVVVAAAAAGFTAS
jgi:hypothetical protein